MNIDIPSALALVASVGGLVWLIIRLSMRPVELTLQDIKNELKSLITREEVERLIELRITQHLQRCIDHKRRCNLEKQLLEQEAKDA